MLYVCICGFHVRKKDRDRERERERERERGRESGCFPDEDFRYANVQDLVSNSFVLF